MAEHREKGDCIIISCCCGPSLESNIYFKYIKVGGDAIIDYVSKGDFFQFFFYF